MERLTKLYNEYKKLLVAIFVIICFACFWITRVQDFKKVLIAIGLQSCGFILLAGKYYLDNSKWNGYSNRKKIEVVLGLFVIVAVLLVCVPEANSVIQHLGIEWNPDGKGRLGFIFLGMGMSKWVQIKLEKQEQELLNG